MNVLFMTHDVAFSLLNDIFKEHKDCIDVWENVFIGANTTILLGDELVLMSLFEQGSFVNKDISGGCWCAGQVYL